MRWAMAGLCVSLWAACALYLYPLKHRPDYGKRLALTTIAACAAAGASYAAAGVTALFSDGGGIPGWVPFPGDIPFLSMAVCFLLCFLLIYACAAMPAGAAVYCAVWAIITQQVAHEVSIVFLGGSGIKNPVMMGICAVGVFAAIYGAAGVTVARYMPEGGTYRVGPRQLTSAVFLLVVFEILFGFLRMELNPSFHDLHTWLVLLVQCYCVTILYLQNTLFKKSAMKQELDTLNQLWHQQKEQYELSRETIALINHKCHDLKHQIAAMRAITSPEEREKYLREIEDSVQIYESIVKTGNEVLDTVLTEKSLSCAANNIKINCIADGRRMGFFDPVDLYTVFGNAIDNAIESVKQLENQEMRMIDVLVYVRKQFLMVNIMNPIGRRLHFEGELPVSTKARNGYHGFGLKSIRHTAGKYGGFMKIDTAEDIFSLKILIPLQNR